MFEKPASRVRPGDDVTRRGKVIRTRRSGREVAITVEGGDTFHVERSGTVTINGEPDGGEPTAEDPAGERSEPDPPPAVTTEQDEGELGDDGDDGDDDGEEE